MQTSLEQSDSPSSVQKHAMSSDAHHNVLPVHNSVATTQTDPRCHRYTDISQVTEISEGPALNGNMARRPPGSGRDQIELQSIPQEHSYTRRDHVRRPRSASPRIDPGTRFDEHGNGSGSELPLPTGSVPGASMTQCNGDRGSKLSYSGARVPSESVAHASSRSRTEAEADMLSRDREPAADSDDRRKPPSSKMRTRSRSWSRDRGPSDEDNTRALADSVGDFDSERVNHERHIRGQSSNVVTVVIEADDRQLRESIEGDVTGTTVWSEASPQHSIQHQPRLPLQSVSDFFS